MIKNKKRGFTLAEILITLGVIGVIAALTIPQIVNYTTKSKIEGNLARAVEQIELGMQNVIQAANDNSEDGSFYNTYYTITYNDLYSNGNTNNISISNISNGFGKSFIGLTPLELTQKQEDEFLQSSAKIFEIRFLDNLEPDHSFTPLTRGAGANNTANFKNFSASIGGYKPASTGEKDGCNNECAYIMIDANGFTTKPNVYGKDIFLFDVTSKGKLRPYGDKEKCTKNDAGNGINCTARVVADGFKINYW